MHCYTRPARGRAQSFFLVPTVPSFGYSQDNNSGLASRERERLEQRRAERDSLGEIASHKGII